MRPAEAEDRAAPLATQLRDLNRRGRCHNFHALPWSGALAGMDSDVRALYTALLGNGHPSADGSWSGRALDSFFHPRGPLADAQRRAAAAFGADATFFGTCGTTAANRAAIEAFGRPGGRVLLDVTSHQSLLFAADGLDVTAAPFTGPAGARVLDVPGTAAVLAAHAARGTPFDLLVLTAAGYDGRRLRLDRALPLLSAASPTTALLVDEAWSAVHAFAPDLAQRTALAVGRRLDRDAAIIVTQSAHKTMAALRQGAYLHVLGGPQDVACVRRAIYRTHTTSPSWPILASLDLARVHAERQGPTLVGRAIRLRRRLAAALRNDPRTAPLLTTAPAGYYQTTDPLTLRLDVAAFGGAPTVREWLFAEHHVLVAGSGGALIVHVHIGVDESDVEALTRALAALVRPGLQGSTLPPPSTASPDLVIGTCVTEYVIPYPPGVPIAFPGEVWTRAHAAALARERATGAEIHHVPGSLVLAGPEPGDEHGGAVTSRALRKGIGEPE